jgi:hypothetical protein
MATKKRKKQRKSRVQGQTLSSHPHNIDHLVLSEYEITDEPLEDRCIKKLPASVQDRIDELCELAQSHPK